MGSLERTALRRSLGRRGFRVRPGVGAGGGGGAWVCPSPGASPPAAGATGLVYDAGVALGGGSFITPWPSKFLGGGYARHVNETDYRYAFDRTTANIFHTANNGLGSFKTSLVIDAGVAGSDGVCLHGVGFQNKGSWPQPSAVKIEVSNDMLDWTVLNASYAVATGTNAWTAIPADSGGDVFRYVRITSTAGDSYFTVVDVELYGEQAPRTLPEDTTPIDFVDNKGLIWWLGTEGGVSGFTNPEGTQLTATPSSTHITNYARNMLNRDGATTVFHSAADGVKTVTFDFGAGDYAGVELTAIGTRQLDSFATAYTNRMGVYVSDDASAWTYVASVDMPSVASAWTYSAVGGGAHRYVRFVQEVGSAYMVLAEVEFWGRLVP